MFMAREDFKHRVVLLSSLIVNLFCVIWFCNFLRNVIIASPTQVSVPGVDGRAISFQSRESTAAEAIGAKMPELVSQAAQSRKR